MKKLSLLVIAVPGFLFLRAQAPAAGQKISYVAATKLTSSVNTPQGQMDIPVTSETTNTVQIKTAAGGTVTGTSSVTHIMSQTSVMGQDMKFDSDDKNAASQPGAADALKDLNKPYDFTIQNGKIQGVTLTVADIMQGGTPAGMVNLLMLPVSASNLKEGYTWTDKLSDPDGSTATLVYTVNKVSNGEATVGLAVTAKFTAVRTQNGMEMTQHFEGTKKSSLVYNTATGLLKSTTSDFDMKGTMDIMGQSMDIAAKGSSTVTSK